MGGYAWVTLATNDSYSLGALVLAHSLKSVGTNHQLAVLITPGVTPSMREKLSSVFNVVKEVNVFDSKDQRNLRILQRPELGITFTKLNCWLLTQFDKCVFLDADTLLLQNADELFEREEFSAAPDVGWPDCFNSGVFVYRPSEDTYSKIVQFALEKGSFDGADQGLLNLYFSDWAHKDISKHLPFIYNTCSTACYSYMPAFKQFSNNIKIIHFIGNSKPWLQYFDVETRQVQVNPGLQHLHGIIQHWWNIFCSNVHQSLTPQMPSSRECTMNYISSYSNNEPSIQFNEVVVSDESNSKVNVWDPWDDYENEQVVEVEITNSPDVFVEPISFPDNTPIVNEPLLDVHEPHQVTDLVTTVPMPETQQHEVVSESLNFTPPSTHTEITTDTSNTHISDNVNVPSSCSDVTFNVCSNTDNSNKLTENAHQPAWSDECEPISCVTNEIALQSTPIETSDVNAGLAGAFAQLTLGVARTIEQSTLEDNLRRQNWESGNIDYMGRDSFDNIWSKICQTLTGTTISEGAPTEQPAAAVPVPSTPSGAEKVEPVQVCPIQPQPDTKEETSPKAEAEVCSKPPAETPSDEPRLPSSLCTRVTLVRQVEPPVVLVPIVPLGIVPVASETPVAVQPSPPQQQSDITCPLVKQAEPTPVPPVAGEPPKVEPAAVPTETPLAAPPVTVPVETAVPTESPVPIVAPTGPPISSAAPTEPIVPTAAPAEPIVPAAAPTEPIVPAPVLAEPPVVAAAPVVSAVPVQPEPPVVAATPAQPPVPVAVLAQPPVPVAVLPEPQVPISAPAEPQVTPAAVIPAGPPKEAAVLAPTEPTPVLPPKPVPESPKVEAKPQPEAQKVEPKPQPEAQKVEPKPQPEAQKDAQPETKKGECPIAPKCELKQEKAAGGKGETQKSEGQPEKPEAKKEEQKAATPKKSESPKKTSSTTKVETKEAPKTPPAKAEVKKEEAAQTTETKTAEGESKKGTKTKEPKEAKSGASKPPAQEATPSGEAQGPAPPPRKSSGTKKPTKSKK